MGRVPSHHSGFFPFLFLPPSHPSLQGKKTAQQKKKSPPQRKGSSEGGWRRKRESPIRKSVRGTGKKGGGGGGERVPLPTPQPSREDGESGGGKDHLQMSSKFTAAIYSSSLPRDVSGRRGGGGGGKTGRCLGRDIDIERCWWWKSVGRGGGKVVVAPEGTFSCCTR